MMNSDKKVYPKDPKLSGQIRDVMDSNEINVVNDRQLYKLDQNITK